MDPTPAIDEEARRVAQLERLVELGMAIARLEGEAAEAFGLGDEATRAHALLRDLRDLAERRLDAAEQDLQRFRAEKGIHPDD